MYLWCPAYLQHICRHFCINNNSPHCRNEWWLRFIFNIFKLLIWSNDLFINQKNKEWSNDLLVVVCFFNMLDIICFLWFEWCVKAPEPCQLLLELSFGVNKSFTHKQLKGYICRTENVFSTGYHHNYPIQCIFLWFPLHLQS